jgi:hypothetical protein
MLMVRPPSLAESVKVERAIGRGYEQTTRTIMLVILVVAVESELGATFSRA